MSFQDSAVIFFIALLLFGPKKLPELARQIGKLMGEFRRASNDFRMQMEDELRISEQAERQKQIAAIEAAAPPTAATLPESSVASEQIGLQAHAELSGAVPLPEIDPLGPEHTIAQPSAPEPPDRHRHETESTALPEPLPIATSGDLTMMPPATGLPVGRPRSTVADAFDSIPQAPSTTVNDIDTNSGTAHHG